MNLELELKERVARRAIHLMPQPQTALRLRKLVADPEHSLSQVVDAVKLDPMLAAAVLRIANSVNHSRGQPTTSLPAAVTRIGEKELARLALASGLGASTSQPGPLLGLRRAAMQDALTSALICELLAPEFNLDAESLFLEGLLHDVGRLVALATLELILTQHPKAPPLEAEAWQAMAQTHHVELGKVLSERWVLPAIVGQVIELHHLPDDGVPDAAAVVRLSDRVLALLHSGAPLTEAELPWLARIEPSRRAPLLEALTGVPFVVSAFETERPAATHSPLIKTPLPQRAPRTGATFPALVTGGRVGEVVLLSARQLLVRTATALPDNHLEEVELQLPDAPLKLWVRVTRSAPVAAGLFEAEATPFAPTGEIARRLGELWTSGEHQERAA